MNKPNNPPAFPQALEISVSRAGITIPESGMTLLDYFAGLAMQGELARDHDGGGEGYEGLARHAYMIATEMLKEREKFL